METLKYEKLVADYYLNLQVKLRSFQAAEANFLDLWVPSEDPLKGVFSMVDAAQVSGQKTIRISLEKETLKRVDLAALKSGLLQMGKVELETQPAGVLLTISDLN